LWGKDYGNDCQALFLPILVALLCWQLAPIALFILALVWTLQVHQGVWFWRFCSAFLWGMLSRRWF
jgi:hypothetical protein